MDGYDLSPIGIALTLAAMVLVAFLVAVWIFLPFAVFGIKERMDSQTALSREILAELKALRSDQKAAQRQPDTHSSA